MKQLRILHCLRAPVGGLFRHVRDLATAQSRIGHLVGVIADSATTDSLTITRLESLKQHLKLGLHLTPMSRSLGWRDLAATRATTAIGRDLKIDIIHGHGAKGGAYGRLAAHRLKGKGHRILSFYTPHGGSLHYAPTTLQGRLYMALERYLAGRTDGLIFESAYSSAIYAANIGFSGINPRIIPNGLLPEEFGDHQPVATASDVLFIGELRHLKGVDVLLHSMARLQHSPPVTAAIVGDGPDAARFKALSQSLDLADRVRFLGAMPASQAFPLGRVLAMPSRAESFPYIVLEAAAAGIPLIATNVGGISEIVAGTDTALIQTNDPLALRDALWEALQDPAARSAKAGRLKASVARRFTVAQMTAEILAYYNSVSH